jgi:hypothetical protein
VKNSKRYENFSIYYENGELIEGYQNKYKIKSAVSKDSMQARNLSFSLFAD